MKYTSLLQAAVLIWLVYDKVRMYDEEIMTNDDNLESNLLTSSLLNDVWFTFWYKLNCVFTAR